jgi:diamine N-acetyltransferase
MSLTLDNISLRALDPEDLDFLYAIENNESIWEISNTVAPYSKFILKKYLKNAQQSIYEAQQLRLVITEKQNNLAIGLIDLFDFDARNARVGLGIIILNKYQNKGFGALVLQIITNYVFNTLQLHQIYVNISEDNAPSLKLFTNFGFQQIGIKKDWNKVNNIYKSEILFQLINS